MWSISWGHLNFEAAAHLGFEKSQSADMIKEWWWGKKKP